MNYEFALFCGDCCVDVLVEQFDKRATVRHRIALLVAQLDEIRIDKLFEFRHNSIGLIQIAKHHQTLAFGCHRQRARDSRRRSLMLLLRTRMLWIIKLLLLHL